MIADLKISVLCVVKSTLANGVVVTKYNIYLHMYLCGAPVVIMFCTTICDYNWCSYCRVLKNGSFYFSPSNPQALLFFIMHA